MSPLVVLALIATVAPMTALPSADAGAPCSYTGLLAYWPADRTGTDVAHGHDITLASGAGYASGKFDSAFSFPATGPATSTLSLGARTGLTVDAWVKFADLRPGSAGNLPNTIFAADNGGGVQEKWVLFVADGYITLHLNGGTASGFYTLGTWPGARGGDANPWIYHHVALRYAAASGWDVLVDGAHSGSTGTGVGFPPATAPFTLGGAEGIGFIHADIDDAAVWGRALTDTEIQTLTAGGPDAKCHAAPPAPLPELPTLVLSLAGLATIAGVVMLRRRS